MIITDITEMSKSKVKVCVDNTETFAIYKGELRTYNIKENQELSSEEYDIICNEVLSKRAKLRAMNLLKSRDYTEYQLRNKLKQGYYPEKVINEALLYVKSFGYVDDIRYATAYIGYAGNSKSKKQIENDLIRKGISKIDIGCAFEQKDEEGSLVKEEELIEKLIVKQHFNISEATIEERRKMISFLYRKGFSLDKIYKVIGQSRDE